MADSKMSKMTEAFKAEFGACLALKGKPPMEHFLELCEIIDKYGLSYRLDNVHCKFFLVHMSNRGGLVLSPFNVHRNAVNIKNSGADLDLLSNSYAFELAADGPRRIKHIEANQKLIVRAAGLIAPINGIERYITLGAGHTSQFCKLADIEGESSEPALCVHGSKRIDRQQLCRNKNLGKMINEGWDWTIFDSSVDEQYPRFSLIAQRALNARNHSNTSVGELECCMTLLTTISDQGFYEIENWREVAIQEIEGTNAPCKDYAGILLDFVCKFSGGHDGWAIKLVDSIAKQYKATLFLGETFWHALAYTEFSDKLHKYPLTRAALLLANLTTDKIEDGKSCSAQSQ